VYRQQDQNAFRRRLAILGEDIEIAAASKLLCRVVEGGQPNRPLYETAVFATLRDKLRSGDVWVERSDSYRHFDSDQALAARGSTGCSHSPASPKFMHEVSRATGSAGAFTKLRTGEPCDSFLRVLLLPRINVALTAARPPNPH